MNSPFQQFSSPGGLNDVFQILRLGAMIGGAIAAAWWFEWLMRSIE